jgi:two-component system response regulator AlgR
MEPIILILDDEYLASSYLEETIEEVQKKLFFFSNFKIKTSNNYQDFMTKLKLFLPKIVFLDIQMPGKNGLEIAIEIRNNYQKIGYENESLPLIIFSTAYYNYAYNAFSVDAIDYILKPANEERIEHVLKKIESQHANIFKEFIEFIKVPSAGIEIDLPLKEVLFFKADMKYTTVVSTKKEFLINKTLLSLEEKFSSFIKIHRAYLVNPAYVQKFYKKDNHWFLSLKNYEEHLPVSRRQKQEIEKKLNYSDIFD